MYKYTLTFLFLLLLAGLFYQPASVGDLQKDLYIGTESKHHIDHSYALQLMSAVTDTSSFEDESILSP